MKKKLFVLISASFLLLMSGQAVRSQSGNEEKKAADETVRLENVGNKICPVSGEKVGSGGMAPATYAHEGKVYNFCCSGCIAEFKKDPQKYTQIVEEEIQAAEESQDKDAVQN